MISRILTFAVTLAVCAAPLAPTAAAQQTVLALEHPAGLAPTAARQQVVGDKSPALAGILSFFIPFGTGSFYAGDNKHGVRHLVIGGVSAVGAGIGLVAACLDGFDICDKDDPGYVIAGVFGLAYAVNWIWGTIVAVNDANRYNRQLRGAALHLGPGLETLVVSAPAGRSMAELAAPRVGLRLAQISF